MLCLGISRLSEQLSATQNVLQRAQCVCSQPIPFPGFAVTLPKALVCCNLQAMHPLSGPRDAAGSDGVSSEMVTVVARGHFSSLCATPLGCCTPCRVQRVTSCAESHLKTSSYSMNASTCDSLVPGQGFAVAGAAQLASRVCCSPAVPPASGRACQSGGAEKWSWRSSARKRSRLCWRP